MAQPGHSASTTRATPRVNPSETYLFTPELRARVQPAERRTSRWLFGDGEFDVDESTAVECMEFERADVAEHRRRGRALREDRDVDQQPVAVEPDARGNRSNDLISRPAMAPAKPSSD